jgi:hypothetical protein
MTITVGNTGGGGYFFPSGGMQGERIAAGQTGVLISAPEVSGVIYKITSLISAASSVQAGISLIANGVTIEDEGNLWDISPTFSPDIDRFAISSTLSASNSAGAYRIYESITCTSFSVVKNTGNTTQTIDIIYQVGELK